MGGSFGPRVLLPAGFARCVRRGRKLPTKSSCCASCQVPGTCPPGTGLETYGLSAHFLSARCRKNERSTPPATPSIPRDPEPFPGCQVFTVPLPRVSSTGPVIVTGSKGPVVPDPVQAQGSAAPGTGVPGRYTCSTAAPGAPSGRYPLDRCSENGQNVA